MEKGSYLAARRVIKRFCRQQDVKIQGCHDHSVDEGEVATATA